MSGRAGKAILIGYLLVIVYAGWMPLNFQADLAKAQAEWHAAVRAWPVGELHHVRRIDVVVNLLVFLPAGVLAARAWRGWRALPAGLAVAALASVTMELGQLFLPDRKCMLSDLVLNALSGLGGAAAVTLLLAAPVRARLGRILLPLKGRPGYLAAGAIAVALLFSAVWPPKLALSRHAVRQQLAAAPRTLAAGLAERPWHAWFMRTALPFGALVLALAGPMTVRPTDARPRRRALRHALAAVPLAVLLALAAQATRLVLRGPPPNPADVALAFAAAMIAAAVSLLLAGQAVELRRTVLGGATALFLAWLYFLWAFPLEASRQGRVPLWGVYWHENAANAYATLGRWAAAAALAFMIGLYLSLRRPWRLEVRMVAGVAGAVAVLSAVAAGRAMLFPVGLDAVALAEQSIAAAGGAALFGALWKLLDRRGSRPNPAYGGPERRQGRRSGSAADRRIDAPAKA